MSKFCANCGSQQPDEANVCGNCGNAFAPENVVPQQVAAKSKKPLIIAVIAAALVVVLVVVLFFTGVFGGGGAAGSPEDAIENYCEYRYYGDVSKYEGLAPDAYWEWKEKENDDFNLDEQIKKMEEKRDEAEEEGAFDDVSYDFEITKEKELSENELKVYKNALNKNFDIPKDSITAGVKVELTLTIEQDGEKDEDDGELYIIEIDGDWYIVHQGGWFLV